MAEVWENLQVDNKPMRAFTVVPEGAGPFPAVVVIQHGGGVDPFIQEMTRRVAAAGYFGIAPDLYHRQDPNAGTDGMTRISKLRDTEVIQDVNATVGFLQSNSRVADDHIGITGFCMGGRVTYLIAAASTAFKAAVPFYGGNTMVAWGDGPTVFDRLASTACPVLGFFGEEDANPSPEDMKKLDAELTRNGVPHEFHSYPDTGHGYMDPTNERSYREKAATASWPIALGFFEKHLGKVPAAR